MSEHFLLNNDTFFVVPEASGGVYTAQQLDTIQKLVQNDAAVVKITEDQRIGLFVSEECYEDCKIKLEKAGLSVRSYQKGLHQPVSCVGGLCPLHQQDALEGCKNITKEIADLSMQMPVRIGLNGCAKSCVASHTLDISLIGEDSGYKIYLGGKNSQIPEMASFAADSVPAKEIAPLIKKVLQTYKELAESEETLKDVIDRIGMTPFAKVLAPYSQDAASFEDTNLLEENAPEEIAVDEDQASSEAYDMSPMEHMDSNQNLSMENDDISPQDFAKEQDSSITENHLEDVLEEDNTALNNLDIKEEDTIINIEETNSLDFKEEENQDDDHIDQLEVSNEELEEISEDESEESLLQSDDVMEEVDEEIKKDEMEEDHIEKQLAADIDETGSIGSDESWSERQQMIANAEDNISIVEEAAAADYLDEQNSNEDENLEHLDLENNDDFSSEKEMIMEDQNQTQKKKILSSLPLQKISKPSWNVESFNLGEMDNLIVTFDNGAEAEIAAEQIMQGQKDYKICGQLIHIDASDMYLKIEAGGIKLTLPRRQAS